MPVDGGRIEDTIKKVLLAVKKYKKRGDSRKKLDKQPGENTKITTYGHKCIRLEMHRETTDKRIRSESRCKMEQYIIKGGNPLVGEVEIGGAKNAALAILAAAIMTDETVQIDNLPDVNDINVMLEAISGIGAMVQRLDRHTVKINGGTIANFDIEYDYIKKIRASYYLLGALLGKYKRAEVALPGGCNIGSRPIDQHLKGFRALGADVDIEHGKIVAEADHLKGPTFISMWFPWARRSM